MGDSRATPQPLDRHDIDQGFVRAKGEPVMLRITNANGSESQIGTWQLPGGLINNYANQSEIGWHITLALKGGAKKVEVLIGEPKP